MTDWGYGEEETERERNHVLAQLRKLDNPFNLLPEEGEEGMPEPIMEGQEIRWVEATHFCGRLLRSFHFRAFRIPALDGGLYWITVDP